MYGLGYTPQINFVTFCNLNLVIFRTFSHLESEVPVGGIIFGHFHILKVRYQFGAQWFINTLSSFVYERVHL